MRVPPEVKERSPRGRMADIGVDPPQAQPLQSSQRGDVGSEVAAARDVDERVRAIDIEPPRIRAGERAVRIGEPDGTAHQRLVLLGAGTVRPVVQRAAIREQTELPAYGEV